MGVHGKWGYTENGVHGKWGLVNAGNGGTHGTLMRNISLLVLDASYPCVEHWLGPTRPVLHVMHHADPTG